MKKSLITFTFIMFYLSSVSQIEIKGSDINAYFLKKDVSVEAGKTLFNLFTIQNRTNKVLTLSLSFNSPANWKLIGKRTQTVVLDSYSEVSLPVRVIVSSTTIGGVGYAVSAILNDEKGNMITSEYCYLKIPAEPSIVVNNTKQSRYFNQDKLSASFLLNIKNTGNINEIVNVNIQPDKTLEILNKEKSEYVSNVFITPSSDTTIRYDVRLKNFDEQNKTRLHKTKISLKSSDTLISKIIWFNYLNWQFENYIQDADKPLVIEFLAQNIFSSLSPNYFLHAYGSILLKNRRKIFYSFENQNRDNKDKHNYWVNSRMLVGYETDKLKIKLGDFTENIVKNMFGRGIYAKYKINNKNEIKAIATNRVLFPISKAGLAYRHRFDNIPVHMEVGAAYTDNRVFYNNDILTFVRTGISLSKNHSFNFLYSINQESESTTYGRPANSGYGYSLEYAGRINSFLINTKTQYGSPGFSGYNRGKLLINTNVSYQISKISNINLYYLKYKYRPLVFINNNFISDRYINTEQAKIRYNRTISPSTNLFGGPVVNLYSSNSFVTYTPNDLFSVVSGELETGVTFSNNYYNNSLTISAQYGYARINKFSSVLNENYHPKLNDLDVSIFQISSNFKHKNSGLFLTYKHGPSSIQQFYAYLYNFYFNKSIILIPYYNHYLIEDKLNLIVRGSFISNLTSKINRLNISPQLNLKLKKGWSFRLLGTISTQKTSYNAANGSTNYSSTYFEFGIKKVFNFNQPRVKYYNYDAIFYKDINGNRMHDANEPGVGNVLVNINRANQQADSDDPNYNGEFRISELLSNSEGRISYINMPEGDYDIKYTPQVNDFGNYLTEDAEKEFNINKDTVMYIPFMEKNKVFGKIIMHRAKHSGLGEIDIENVKIIVQGGGKTYSDLTDKNGYFELFIPVTDYYKVSVDNLFYENFNLRQNSFQIKFNGYKQFEVNFDFDEKERVVEGLDNVDFNIFDDDSEDGFKPENVISLRQTNLKGVIRDAYTQIPIHANVFISNAETGELITSAPSGIKNGSFFTSFYSSKRYLIKVEAKGYWTETEVIASDQVTSFENITRNYILEKIKKGDIIETQNLMFNSKSSELLAAAKGELENIILKLAKNQDVKIEIVGHTDNLEAISGDGKKLSEARAKAILEYLSSRGILSSRLQISGMGDKKPIVDNDSKEGRATNRRVELKIIDY